MISRYLARASTNFGLNAAKQIRMPRLVQTPLARFSDSKASQQGATYEDVENIPKEDFDRMKENLKKFQQCMSLGKYAQAQQILNEHRFDVENNFGPDHPAQLSVDNNQALLLKLDGNKEEAKRIF